MDKIELKELMIAELSKEIPEDEIRDGESLRELVLANMNEPLVDKLIDEFCKMNPEAGAVLNPFDFNDPIQNAAETAESIEYKMLMNKAGLAYRTKEIEKTIQELIDLITRYAS